MLRLLSTALDRAVIRMASSTHVDRSGQSSNAVEAQKWFAKEGLFAGISGIAPPEMAFSSGNEFQFLSPIASRWRQNNRVFGKLFRAGARWNTRPSVILLHGWNAELHYP